MGEDDSGDKTEEPTPHKLREARKKGQIAKSKEMTSAILIFVAFYTLKSQATNLWSNMEISTIQTLQAISEPFNETVAGHLLSDALFTFLKSLLPILLTVFAVAIVIESIQTGFLVSFDSITPKLEKLNPIEGFKKFFSLKQYVELAKSLIKITVVVWILIGVIKDEFRTVLLSQELGFWEIMNFTGNLVMTVITRVGMFYLIVAIFDYFYQRFEYMKSMRMSKKEIKDEYKRLEGDPTIKQRQREAARQMAMGRQMGSVPNADVVVTNPTHIAIALEYKPNGMNAPLVLAKGKRIVAQQIRELAEKHNIPIVENPPLAQALYPIVEPDMAIPPQFYKAVAEILAFVYNLRKKRSRRY
ncbi:flagellar biosynthesis protein FlhB [bacterium]|nr:flagellar biosynthesis protein FlhB [bacterium]